MRYKNVIIILVLIIVLSTSAVFYFKIQNAAQAADIDDPKNWIREQNTQVVLSVFKITKGKGRLTPQGQEYNSHEYDTVFTLDSWYEGEYFQDEYIKEGVTKMRVTPRFNPNDGIPEIYAIERYENERLEVYFFVDEDWKHKKSFTNILYGLNYQYDKEFKYNSLGHGIYYDMIIDDKARIHENGVKSAGPIIGDITKEDPWNKTIVQLI